MAFPNPSNLQIRCGTEATEGHGDVANWSDVRVLSETLGGNFPQLRDESIIASAEWPPSLPTKIDPGGDLQWQRRHAGHFA